MTARVGRPARAVSISGHLRCGSWGCLIPLGASLDRDRSFREVSALRPYEILVIVDPRPTDEEIAALLTQLGEQVKTLGAEVGTMENWGKRRLAYDIRKQREGTYAVFTVSAEPAMIREFERQLRLHESVLRFLSPGVP